jgi:hypothetical protein
MPNEEKNRRDGVHSIDDISGSSQINRERRYLMGRRCQKRQNFMRGKSCTDIERKKTDTRHIHALDI